MTSPGSTEGPASADSGDGTVATRPAAEVADVRRVPRWRRILVGFLVVLACLLAVVSVLAVWVSGTLLDTDQWVSTVGPLASKPSIQQGVANCVTNALTENVDVQGKVEDALPPHAPTSSRPTSPPASRDSCTRRR